MLIYFTNTRKWPILRWIFFHPTFIPPYRALSLSLSFSLSLIPLHAPLRSSWSAIPRLTSPQQLWTFTWVIWPIHGNCRVSRTSASTCSFWAPPNIQKKMNTTNFYRYYGIVLCNWVCLPIQWIRQMVTSPIGQRCAPLVFYGIGIYVF